MAIFLASMMQLKTVLTKLLKNENIYSIIGVKRNNFITYKSCKGQGRFQQSMFRNTKFIMLKFVCFIFKFILHFIECFFYFTFFYKYLNKIYIKMFTTYIFASIKCFRYKEEHILLRKYDYEKCFM